MATDKQITTAFNAGYIIQDKDSELVDKLISTENTANEVVQALIEGAKTFQKEKIAKQQQEIKERQNNKSKTR